MSEVRTSCLQDRDYVLGTDLMHLFSGNAVTSCANMAEYLAIHGLSNSIESQCLSELQRAISESRGNILKLCNTDDWNFTNLVQQGGVAKDGLTIRKPRIAVEHWYNRNHRNLRVRWRPATVDGNDFLNEPNYYDKHRGFDVPPGELIYIRNFDVLKESASVDNQAVVDWREALRNRILGIALLYIDNFVHDLQSNFDVSLGERMFYSIGLRPDFVSNLEFRSQ